MNHTGLEPDREFRRQHPDPHIEMGRTLLDAEAMTTPAKACKSGLHACLLDAEAMTTRRSQPARGWLDRHRHPLTSASAHEAAAALVNHHGLDDSLVWARALVQCIEIEASRNRAQAARRAGL